MNTSYLQTIGAPDHKLAMRDLKPLSGLGSDDRAAFWSGWAALPALRRAEITRAMVDLAEDNVDLDFGEVLYWCLDDADLAVRATAVEGLWESGSGRVLRRLTALLRSDPSPDVRAAAAIGLSRFAYMSSLDELGEADTDRLRDVLTEAILDQREPLEVRRRALESAGYFAEADEVQRQIGLAYASDELLLRESALVAMGRSMLPRWLPSLADGLTSPSPALRYEAARAAGELSEEARPLLSQIVRLVNDGDSEVALAAIWALGEIGGPAARRTLQQVRKSQDESRRQAAAEALEELSLGEGLFGAE